MMLCLGDAWEMMVLSQGLLVAGWSRVIVVKVIAEGCVGEMMRVVQVTVCCTTEVMLWYEYEYA